MKDWGPPVPARARWEFTPDEANGLALAADEVVGVWPTESSWWFARKPGGAEGYVPRSFVRVEDDRNEAYFSAAGARSPVATRRSRHRAKRGPRPGRRAASVRSTTTALDMVWVVTCCLLAVAPVALIGRWITADPPGMAIPAASMRKPPASQLFSSAARVCFGPGACHDPNTLLSSGGAEARPLWRNASSMLGPGARRCCPNCTRGLKSCTASHVEEHLFVERILPLLDARGANVPRNRRPERRTGVKYDISTALPGMARHPRRSGPAPLPEARSRAPVNRGHRVGHLPCAQHGLVLQVARAIKHNSAEAYTGTP